MTQDRDQLPSAPPKEGEILPPERTFQLTETEICLKEQMDALLGRAVHLAYKAGIPVYDYGFSFNEVFGNKMGLLTIQTSKPGMSIQTVSYTAEVDEQQGSVKFVHTQNNDYSYTSTSGTHITSRESPTITEIVVGLDDDGLLEPRSYAAFIEDFAGRIGIDPITLAALIKDERIIDATPAAFDALEGLTNE